MEHFHLIPADFDYYNLDDLLDENKNNGVCWKNIQNQAFNIGDTVYIYFHDSKGLTDRILLRAKVLKSDSTDDNKYNENKDKYLYSEYCKRELQNKERLALRSEEEIEEFKNDSKLKIKGFYLHEFKAISKEKENDFIYIHGKKDDHNTGIMGVRISQTKIYLDKQEDEKYINLLNKLKEKNVFTRNVETLRDYYNKDSCILCTEKELDKHSFRKPNNLYYYEIHHILQQSFNKVINNGKDIPSWFKKKYIENDINTLIYNNYNEVRLCPYHHNQLHYGKYEDRKEILDKLVNDNYKKELLNKVQNEKEVDEILEYIYKQYKVSYK